MHFAKSGSPTYENEMKWGKRGQSARFMTLSSSFAGIEQTVKAFASSNLGKNILGLSAE